MHLALQLEHLSRNYALLNVATLVNHVDLSIYKGNKSESNNSCYVFPILVKYRNNLKPRF